MENKNYVVYKAELHSGTYFYLPMSKYCYDNLPRKPNIIKRTIIRDKLTLKKADNFWEIISKLNGK